MQPLKGLYVIADIDCAGADTIISKTEEVLSAGVKIIQYRDKVSTQSDRYKIAENLRKLTQAHNCLLLINDDTELAVSIDADGIHLGKDDMSIQEARSVLGDKKIIGASCYASYMNAKPVIEASANYIAFGSFFSSPTKPDAPRAEIELLQRAKQDFKVPVCAIGGITPQNAAPLIAAEADMIAVISSVFNASSPKRAVQEYLSIM